MLPQLPLFTKPLKCLKTVPVAVTSRFEYNQSFDWHLEEGRDVKNSQEDIRTQAANTFLSDIICAVHFCDICKLKATKAFKHIKPLYFLLFTESQHHVSQEGLERSWWLNPKCPYWHPDILNSWSCSSARDWTSHFSDCLYLNPEALIKFNIWVWWSLPHSPVLCYTFNQWTN